MAEGSVGHLPATAQRPDQVLGGHPDVGQEDLVEVEVVAVVHARERPAGHPGRVGGNQQCADPLVFGRVGIGADEGEQHVGVVRAGRPDLLTVDDEVVAVAHRTRAQAGEVGARAGFAHAERRRDLGAQDGHRPPLLLFVRAERQQRRRDDADALRIERVIDAPPRQLLAVHELLEDVRVAAAELRRISRQQPTVVELQPLPAPRPLRHVRRRARSLRGRLGLGRQMFVEERDELGAECLDLVIEPQLHRPNISST